MPRTYEAIATTTLGSGQTNVTFSSIPGTYTDLVLVCNIIGGTGTATTDITFNNDTGTNYSSTYVYGTGSSTVSGRSTNSNYIFGNINSLDTNDVAGIIVQIQNYSNTTTNKTVLSRASYVDGFAQAVVGLWRNTAAISTVNISARSTNTFATNSTFTLYGIKAA